MPLFQNAVQRLPRYLPGHLYILLFKILSECDVQDYHIMYINLYNEFRTVTRGDSENVNDDIVFEMELI
ncbi:MAG: hypothetical protein ABJC12_10525, partial [Saprospiraceae bacterium]